MHNSRKFEKIKIKSAEKDTKLITTLDEETWWAFELVVVAFLRRLTLCMCILELHYYKLDFNF